MATCSTPGSNATPTSSGLLSGLTNVYNTLASISPLNVAGLAPSLTGAANTGTGTSSSRSWADDLLIVVGIVMGLGALMGGAKPAIVKVTDTATKVAAVAA